MKTQSDPFGDLPRASNQNPEFFINHQNDTKRQELRSRLEEFVGPLSDGKFQDLLPIAKFDFERAVGEYLDCTQIEATQRGTPATNNAVSAVENEEKLFVEDDEESIDDSDTKTTRETSPIEPSADQPVDQPTNNEPQPVAEDTNEWKNDCRYLGSLQASAWCTRQGTNVVKFNERLRIDRSGQINNQPKVSFFKNKEDFNVRFYNSQGLNFARACEEEARFMSVLLDAGVCKFEATVIYADTRIRVGSTVIVMVDCYLKRSAFSTISTFSMDLESNKKKTIIDETKETKEERLVRQRQQALVDLFKRLELLNSDSSLITSAQDPNQAPKEAPSQPGVLSAEDEGDVLDEDQLQMFYDSAESSRQKLEGEVAEPPPSFALSLFPYQKRGLAWMLSREKEWANIDETRSETHPLWSEFRWPGGEPFWANLNSGELSLSRPTLALKSRGGILADDMGLGKTISALALVHSGVNESKGHSTLIVAPMSLLSQWESEIQKASVSSHDCGCFIYYGTNTSPSRNLLREFLSSHRCKRKIVLTTYGTVKFEHNSLQRSQNKDESILFATSFDRIILDEAQNIKNRITLAAKACFDLKGQRRWVLTGTPVVNRLEDLYSLVRFIGIEPWNNFRFWRSFITEKFQKSETREIAMKTVQAIVAPICLRRTKAMKDPLTGQPLVCLPKKTVEIKRVPFSPEEKTIYSHLFARIRESVRAKVMDGTASTKYVAILKLLIRLRQICCHPLLLLSSDDEGDTTTTDTSIDGSGEPEGPPNPKRLKTSNRKISQGLDNDLRLDLTANLNSLIEQFASMPSSTPSPQYTAQTFSKLLEHPLEKEECPICSDQQEEPVLTECLHSACRDCLFTHIEYLKKRGDALVCHICRGPIDSARLYKVNYNKRELQPLNEKLQSTKVRALVAALSNASSRNVGKAVVFSYFTSFLDLIEINLRDAGFPVYRFDGGMSKNKRSTSIETFINCPQKNAVLLLSQLAGGTGLNLVAAKQAYLMDPWWNYATESQAMDRIHRMGQTHDVNITRFIIEGSIEERMLTIQEHKHALSDLVTSGEERKSETLENLKMLLDLGDEKSVSTL